MDKPRDENYVKWIMKEGKDLIKESQPDADDFRSLYKKDFAEGIVTLIEFEYGEKLLNEQSKRGVITTFMTGAES